MKEGNKQIDSGAPESRIIKGELFDKLNVDDLKAVIAAQTEIAKLPYGKFNPKAMEIAKKHGFDYVP